MLVAACYGPSVPEGVACSDHKACPSEQSCYFGKCFTEAPPCVPIDDGSGHLTAPLLDSAITLDGDLSDWPTCFISIDHDNAGEVRDLDGLGKFAPGRFSVAADANHLYLAAEVQGIAPLGDQPVPDVFLNNAISVYFDGDGIATTASYDDDAAQIVVDHANREQAFHSGSLGTNPDVASAASTTGTTFTIEMTVEPATFGLARFGSTIGFDIGLVAGDGSAMSSELVWFQRCAEPQCGCSNEPAAPFCDAREFGTLAIGP
jgi:hypothetical protein